MSAKISMMGGGRGGTIRAEASISMNTECKDISVAHLAASWATNIRPDVTKTWNLEMCGYGEVSEYVELSVIWVIYILS